MKYFFKFIRIFIFIQQKITIIIIILLLHRFKISMRINEEIKNNKIKYSIKKFF